MKVSVRAAALFLLFIFVSLVGFGITGSSLEIELNEQSDLVQADQRHLIGKNRYIRSDEWVVFTPMAIAQFNHEPRFPILNKNLGPDGQNMLVVGMAGVPVSHVSQLAKPATWGFFIFDLRRALAWYWWLPVFGSLFAVWGVMGILAPRRWWLGLATAATFVTSGYVVAWSNWPAYTVLFPATAFCIYFQIFQAESWSRLLAFGVALGLSLAGFFLVLYPPWQVSVGYLFLFLTVGVAVRDRLWAHLNVRRNIAFALSATVAGFICWAWWSDAKLAIDAIQATVYPGQRRALLGGTLMPWEAFRGFLNHHTLYYENAKLTNQSESASFIYLFPVVIAAAIIRAFRKKFPSWPEMALIIFCLFVLWFQFVGIGLSLAEWSLWGRVQPGRTDLALGLASILLCGASIASLHAEGSLKRIEAATIGMAWTVTVMLAVMSTPEGAIGKVNVLMWLLLIPFVFLLSYWLLIKQVKLFMLGSLFVTFSMSLPFNPLVQAPSEIVPANGLLENARTQSHRVLGIGSQIMGLLAAGVPIANAAFYYPQQSIWKALDPTGKNTSITNRYHHLFYIPDESSSDVTDYQIELVGIDMVAIKFQPQRFDFRLSGAERILAPNSLDLSGNPYLRLLQKGSANSLYSVAIKSENTAQMQQAIPASGAAIDSTNLVTFSSTETSLQGWVVSHASKVKEVQLRDANGLALASSNRFFPRGDVALGFAENGNKNVPLNSGFSLAASGITSTKSISFVAIMADGAEFSVSYANTPLSKGIAATDNKGHGITFAFDIRTEPVSK